MGKFKNTFSSKIKKSKWQNLVHFCEICSVLYNSKKLKFPENMTFYMYRKDILTFRITIFIFCLQHEPDI